MELRVSSEIVSQLSAVDDGFACRVNGSLERYECELSPYLNSAHTWVFTPTSSLEKSLENAFAAGDYKSLNKLYWTDLFESIDATRNFFLKRSKPLVISSVELINRGDFISSAPIVRSLFELSIWALQHSATFKNTLKEYNSKANPAVHILDASTLQNLIVKLIWGTRLKDRTKKNKELSQMHIIDEFKKVAKRDELNFIEPTYDFLCELCHPNAVGNWLFANAEDLDIAKPRINTSILNAQSGAERDNALLHICGALSWGLLALANSNLQFDEALLWIDSKFGLARLKQ